MDKTAYLEELKKRAREVLVGLEVDPASVDDALTVGEVVEALSKHMAISMVFDMVLGVTVDGLDEMDTAYIPRDWPYHNGEQGQVSVVELSPIPSRENPYFYDGARQGVQLQTRDDGSFVEAMYMNHIADVDRVVVLVDTRTGRRFKVELPA